MKLLLQLQKNVKILDLTQERPDTIQFLKKQVADVVQEFKKLKEVTTYILLLCIYTNYAFEYIIHIQLLRNAQLVKETHHVSSYTYPEKFPLAMILSAVHVVSLIQPYTHSM